MIKVKQLTLLLSIFGLAAVVCNSYAADRDMKIDEVLTQYEIVYENMVDDPDLASGDNPPLLDSQMPQEEKELIKEFLGDLEEIGVQAADDFNLDLYEAPIEEQNSKEKDVAAPDMEPKLSLSLKLATEAEELPENAIIDILQLKDINIVDVLKMISQKSGLNIIAGKDVKGKVSIYLKDVSLKNALRIILDSNNLAYKMEDGIVRVMMATEFETRYGYKFGGRIETRIVHLSYADVNDVVVMLNQLKSLSGKIIHDIKSNTIVLMDSAAKLNVMEKLLQ